MQFERHTEVSPSLPIIMYTAQDLINKGWQVDPDVPPTGIGFSHVVHFIREIPEESDVPKRKPGRPRQEG